MAKDITDYKITAPLEGFSKKDIRSVINVLSKINAKSFEEFFFERKSLRQIAKEEGVSSHAIEKRVRVAVRDIYYYFDYADVLQGLKDNPYFEYKKRALLDLRKAFKEKTKKLDLKTEIVPFLTEHEKAVFENFIQDYNPKKYEAFLSAHGYKMPDQPFGGIEALNAKLDKLIEKKQEIRALLSKIRYSGHRNLFLNSLTEEEKLYFTRRLTSVDPRPDEKVFEDHKEMLAKISEIRGEVERKIRHVLDFRQKEARFYEQIGGRNQLSDIELFLNTYEKCFLFEDYLNIDPNGRNIVCEKLGLKPAEYEKLILQTEATIDGVLTNKRRSQKFISDNGGEDFLINEFGATLSEDEFDAMLTCLMDYHYGDLNYIQSNESENLYQVVMRVVKKLSDYKQRKKSIDEYVAKVGEKNILEFAKILTNSERKILFKYILGYHQPSAKELSAELGVDEDKVIGAIANVERWLKDFEQNKKLPFKWLDPPPKQKY